MDYLRLLGSINAENFKEFRFYFNNLIKVHITITKRGINYEIITNFLTNLYDISLIDMTINIMAFNMFIH